MNEKSRKYIREYMRKKRRAEGALTRSEYSELRAIYSAYKLGNFRGESLTDQIDGLVDRYSI